MIVVAYRNCEILMTEKYITVVQERVGTQVYGPVAMSLEGLEWAIKLAKNLAGGTNADHADAAAR